MSNLVLTNDEITLIINMLYVRRNELAGKTQNTGTNVTELMIQTYEENEKLLQYFKSKVKEY